jgi:putative N6-adenine-specific DNA methylase
MFSYQETKQFFAQIADEITPLGVTELERLNARAIKPVYRGIYFEADFAALFNIVYQTRFASRLFAPLDRFHCYSTQYLYKRAKTIPWDHFFRLDQTFAISATLANSKLKHSQYAALTLKDAIVDYFREKFGTRPGVDRNEPDIKFNLRIDNDRASISLDLGAGSLHRRGYRKVQVEAPMQETLAAAIIELAEWDGSRPLTDPMCGSGTLLGEALIKYCRIPAGYLRDRFGFEFLPEFDAKLWQQIKKSADDQIRELPAGLISGSDISGEAIGAARENLQLLPFGNRIQLNTQSLADLADLSGHVFVINPPYGIRMGTKTAAETLCQELGDFLKQRAQNSTAFIYFGDPGLIPQIGLRAAWKKKLKNGSLDGRLAKFEIY